MGSATVDHLARRGRRVLGLERFDIPNALGSSHGITRIIRLAYFEHPSYVPLLRRAYSLWAELERDAGERLLYTTGSLDVSVVGERIFAGSLQSCQVHGLPHEVLSGSQISRRFPGYRLPANSRAVFQPQGGFLLPERCIVAHVERAMTRGAEVHGREAVAGFEEVAGGVRVSTSRAVYEADRLVITAGAWTGALLDQLRLFAIPERQVMGWFAPSQANLFRTGQFPVFVMEAEEGTYYGFPLFGIPGFKVGKYHHLEERVDPDRLDREPRPADEAALRPFVERYFPDGSGPLTAMAVCMFTNSPDEHFIIDTLPGAPRVSIAAGFSGHGYKFCSVVGEIMADLVERGETEHDIGLFRLARFPGGPAHPL